MFQPSDLLERFDGIAQGTFLQRFGCTRKQLAEHTNSGDIIRVRPGVFAVPTLDPRVITAAAHGGELTCSEALRERKVWVLPAPNNEVHVWLGGSGRKHAHEPCACITHYSAGRSGLGIASAANALIHAFRCLDREAFFAAYESAWNRRLLSATDRARIRRELPKSVGWLLDLARPDAESGLESLLRLRLHLLGIQLDCQVDIEDVGRVDFVVAGRIILEADGKDNHTAAKRHKDLLRDAAASARGYETLRFDYAMIVHDWDTVVAAILPALARARH
ncbi:MAG: endonuclease domain-containing protein [Microbacterium sp.]|uniref:endonuclease domain-containing protein n=1 Tax=Microbacterium sp. TaxID=51671 RepID=UPI003F9576B3